MVQYRFGGRGLTTGSEDGRAAQNTQARCTATTWQIETAEQLSSAYSSFRQLVSLQPVGKAGKLVELKLPELHIPASLLYFCPCHQKYFKPNRPCRPYVPSSCLSAPPLVLIISSFTSCPTFRRGPRKEFILAKSPKTCPALRYDVLRVTFVFSTAADITLKQNFGKRKLDQNCKKKEIRLQIVRELSRIPSLINDLTQKPPCWHQKRMIVP